jgi:hypothetical protein
VTGKGVLQWPAVGGLRGCIQVPTAVSTDDPFRRGAGSGPAIALATT